VRRWEWQTAEVLRHGPGGGERSVRRGHLRHYRPSCVPPTSKPSTCTGKNSTTSSAAAGAPVPLGGVLGSLNVDEVLWLAGLFGDICLSS